MNILFHSNQISERGTEVALFDYAAGNQTVLQNRSFIAVPKNKIFDTVVFEKFKKNFELCLYETMDELNLFIKNNKIELLYKIVFGNKEDIIDTIPVFIHCVFSTREKHGAYYVPISEYLNIWFRTKYPVLPHIVKKFSGSEHTLREDLNIPRDATVFGGYGGEKSFNIDFVQETICQIALQRKDIYFIFLNFKPFVPSDKLTVYKNILFLPKNTDRDYKEYFINTCDAMIHARNDGETFGLSIAEFSVKNKPVITWDPDFLHNFTFCLKEFLRYIINKYPVYYKAHLHHLKEKAIRYTNKKDLADILLNFKEKYLKPINYDCFSESFSEEKVMKIFNNIITGKIKS
jgi:hypothetical protein